MRRGDDILFCHFSSTRTLIFKTKPVPKLEQILISSMKQSVGKSLMPNTSLSTQSRKIVLFSKETRLSLHFFLGHRGILNAEKKGIGRASFSPLQFFLFYFFSAKKRQKGLLNYIHKRKYIVSWEMSSEIRSVQE